MDDRLPTRAVADADAVAVAVAIAFPAAAALAPTLTAVLDGMQVHEMRRDHP